MAQPNQLDDLFSPEKPLRNAVLAQLSGLDVSEQSAFAERAAAAPLDRRLAVAQRMVDLSEDDATLDFSAAFAVLLRDADAEVRRTAIEGLWEDEDRELIQPLVGLLRSDPDLGVRAAAALSLGRYVVLNEFEALRPADGTLVLEALREVVGDSEQPPELRARALEAVGAASQPWVSDLIWRAYDSEEERMQISALHAMGRNADSKWLPTLYDEMQSAEPERRFEAAGAAGQIGDDDAVPQLADLYDDSDREVQEAAIAAIGQIGGEVAIEALQEHVNDPDERLADAVRAALVDAQDGSLLGGAGLVPGLDLLDDDDVEDLIDADEGG